MAGPCPTKREAELSGYVLVTPVKDEAATIGRTIRSVLNQTLLPLEWVIVSDGSTDGTDQIVKEAAAQHPWIRLISLPPRQERSFAAVVENTQRGIADLQSSDYAFLGLLDADVTFQRDYFEQLIDRFGANPQLGLAGGVVIDVGTPRDRFPRNRRDVPGAVQFFRRSCFESLGGLIAVPEGGWDGLTCAAARLKGYETQLCTDLVVDHLKPRNISQGGVLRRKWQMGVRDYAIGYDPLFEIVKCIGRLKEAPMIAGSLAWVVGYFSAMATRPRRVVPLELIAQVQREQRERLHGLFSAKSIKANPNHRRTRS
jgi:biofilm PGA synthesis N-glycosyltransferase PgaC